MARYLVRRTGSVVLVLLGVLTLVFFAQRVSGDPVALLVPVGATAEDVERIRDDLGLNEPIFVQYATFIGNAVQGDFGDSIRYRSPALPVVLDALVITLQLTVISMLGAALFGTVLGILAAAKRGSIFDLGAISISVVGQAMPNFWLGILLILIFAVQMGVLPTGGWGTPQQIVLPAVTLGAYSTARISRLVRSGMIEVLGQDYVRTARAKGLGNLRIIILHAYRNALLPVVTVTGLEFAVLLGGAVITETIFSIPGMGRLVVDSVLGRDYPIVQAAVFVFALIVALQNLAVDISYAVLDPRVRLGKVATTA